METHENNFKTSRIYLIMDITTATFGILILIAAAAPLVERIILVMQGEPIGMIAGLMLILVITAAVCILTLMLIAAVQYRYEVRRCKEIKDEIHELDNIIMSFINEINGIITALESRTKDN